MPKNISVTLAICVLGGAIAFASLFIPARDVATHVPTDAVPATSGPSLGTPEVVVAAFTFSNPGPVPAGTELIVTNADSVPHTLTAVDGSFDSGLLAPGDQVRLIVPATPGTFDFFCEVHPSMTASLIVS